MVMFESFSTFVTYVGDWVGSLQEPKEALQAELLFTVQSMNDMMAFLKPALSDDLQFRPFWPHTVSEADAVVEQLRMMAKAVLYGSRKDQAIIQAFLNHRGLHMLVSCLLFVRLSPSIKAQGWQSLCLVLQNVKDRDVSMPTTYRCHRHTTSRHKVPKVIEVKKKTCLPMASI